VQNLTANFPRGTLWLVLPFFAAALVLQLPGNVPYDGIVVWHEAETRHLYAQHPSVLVLVWWLAEQAVRGPALFTALQLAALWAAAAILLRRSAPPLWAAAAFLGVLLLWPPMLAMSGVTVKDVFGAHLCLLAFALALPREDRPHEPILWFSAFALGMLAALVRYQLGLILPVLAFQLWSQCRHCRGSMPGASLGAASGAFAITAVAAVAVSMLFVRSGGNDLEQSFRKILIFDVAGVVANDPAIRLPDFAAKRVDVGNLKTEIRHDYSPERVDTLWQDGTGRGSGLLDPRGVFRILAHIPDRVVIAQWKDAVLDAPRALLIHRSEAFARVLGFRDLYACRPIRAGISPLPPAQSAAVQATSYRVPYSAHIMESRWFPAGFTFRAWFYALIGIVVLVAGLFGAPREAVLLVSFGLLYESSFYFLPQACEVRYSYPLMLSVIVAVVLWGYRRLRPMA
jgi:hypothetical protein